jgi:pimeloyl-ACP methyl ester carboxylesterase
MSDPREVHVTAFDGLKLFVRDWGPDEGNLLPVVCLPGLTRNSLDFEDLARALSASGRRVICPDFRGRGRSAYDQNWQANYAPPTYARDVLDTMAALGVHHAAFIGTSLGGIVTMLIAAGRPTSVAAAVLNDIGPRIEPAGIARIAAYAGKQEEVSDWPAAVAQLKAANAGALPSLDDDGWMRFARRQFVETPGGRLRPNYDSRIGDAMRAGGPPVDLKALFLALGDIPTLVVRGALSDILSDEGVVEMRAAKPDLSSVTMPGLGHAPLLDEPAAREAIEGFLARVA